MESVILVFFVLFATLYSLNKVSYVLLKGLIFNQRKWDLNICCGKTDGGGINADIVRHNSSVANFKLIHDIYNLPFANKEFDSVICSHTMEHVDNPQLFDRELRRVGSQVVYIVPPLWDIAAACNLLEHKWIFLTLRKKHHSLPPCMRLPFSRTIHRYLEQRVTA